MKKIFSLFAAVLFAGSMFATEVTFTKEDFAGQGTANTGSEVSATKDGVTFTFSKGYCADESLRCYAHGALSITASETIEKINFTTTGGKTGGLDAEVEVGATSYSVADLASQARFTEIKVTLADGGDTPQEDTWTVAGSSTVAFGTSWDPANTANDMVKQNDGTFKWEKENLELADGSVDFKVAKNHSWDEAYPSQDYHLAIDAAGIYTITITFEPENENAVNATATKTGEAVVVPTVIMHGTFSGSWADTEAFATADDKKTASLTLTLAAGDIEFGMKFDGAWKANGATITRENASTSLASGEGNMHLTADVDGEYTFTYTYETQTLAVTFPVVLPDPTNCAEAAEAALSVENNNDLYNGGKEYTIEGYVTSIASAYSDKFHNISFWMADVADGGNVLQAYRAACATAADAPNVGDKVAVTGQLTKYGTTPEFAQGCTFVIIERAEVEEPENLGPKTIAEFLQLKNEKDTCVLTGVVKNIKMNSDGTVNKYGNFDLVDAENDEVSVYIYGLLTAAGEAQKFDEMGIEENDILTLKAVYTEYNGKPQAKNAVFVSVEKTGTAIDNATVATKAQKMIIDGQLFIIRDGVMFNANGAAVK